MAMPRKKLGARVLGPYERSGSWRVVVVGADGGRADHTCETEAEARRLIAVTQARQAREAITSLDDAFDKYEDHLIAKGNKPRSYEETLRRLRRFFEGVTSLGSLKPAACQALYNRLLDATYWTKGPIIVEMPTYSADSHRNYLAESRSFLTWVVAQGWLRANPLADVRGMGRRTKHGKAQLRTDEARAWEAKAWALADKGDEGALAALMALYLAMRTGEIVSRVVRDLDDEGRVLWIEAGKTAASRRALEVPERIRPLLVAHCKGKGAEALLFPGHLRDWVTDQVKRVCGLAGVPVVTAHGLRGTASTLATVRGMLGRAVADSLGHESVTTTTDSYVAPGAAAEADRRRGLTILEGGRTVGKKR